ncbi:lipolytic protein-like protein G-D-S-L family [Pseudovirgaria hyperparasitica]|uniref:Lipolytic protein-like protein G-D-S-L family n=1 Tax=Pseudovirgaria hyperparasitica TaxID=470096 RepID=A0A6A6W402_9PEZI|nr:lipolytic protein-like protein G-D-S-L family [Pseudovirgaria hyperparasitica]KAF2757582.1 lipolytic protein-like protein G-D-S-L family [Pseudovirgaria hyperparasitica]
MLIQARLVYALATVGHVRAIQYLGRVNPNTKELTWPGTGVSFTFSGTTATISISASGANSADLIVDGAITTILNVAGTSISTAKLPRGNHTVELRRRSETQYGTITIGNITTDGTFNADVLPKRKIEIVGDSISVGYGLDGVNPCTNTAAVEDNPKTFGALTAKALNASYSVVAWSGKGLTRNYITVDPDTSPIMPQYWTRYGANDADNSYTFPSSATPDVVVINLGTNDFSYIAYDSAGQPYNARALLNATVFASAMVSFVQTVQKKYVKAHVFLMTSPMLSDGYPSAAEAQKSTQRNALAAATARLGGEKVHLVEWATQGADVGCDYHPNAATHAAGAMVLLQAVKGVMGW